MATWNTDNPKVGNTIAADIPDIEENFQELHDVIEAITNGTLGTTTAANFKVDVLADDADCGTHPVITTGVNDGSQDIDFPANNMSACKFMTGDSNTITWMYLNTAPPGWKALSTGADTVCGISGGTGDYNVNGGNPDSSATWARGDHTLTEAEVPAHAHKIMTHNGSNGNKGIQYYLDNTDYSYTTNNETDSFGGGGAHNHGNTWRPSASVGKLFQLDTA